MVKSCDYLPVVRIKPEDLESFIDSQQGDPRNVYVTVFKEEHLVKHRSGNPFQLQDYYQYPENYISQFDQYLQYITIIVNTIYWESRYPRFVTWESLKKLHNKLFYRIFQLK